MSKQRGQKTQEERDEEFWSQMDSFFGPANDPTPSTGRAEENVAMKRRRTVEMEVVEGEPKAKESVRAETESAQTDQKATETHDVSPAERLAPKPTPNASVLLVPEEPEAEIGQPTTSTATVTRTSSVVHNHYYHGVGTVIHTTVGETERARIRVRQTVRTNEDGGIVVERPGTRSTVDGRRTFSVLNIRVGRFPEKDVHNAIVWLLSTFGIVCDRNAVTLIGHAHAMPRKSPNLYHIDFTISSSIAVQIDAVLAEKELCETGEGCRRLCIKHKQSYDEMLEQEILDIGWSVLFDRIAPVVPTIRQKTLVYALAELPNKQVTVTVRELLADDGVADVIEKTLNRPARLTIREWLQQ